MAPNQLSVALLRRANDRGFEFTSACIQKSDDFFNNCESSAQAAGQSTRPCFFQADQILKDCINGPAKRENNRGFEFTSACLQKSDEVFNSCKESAQAAGQSTRSCFTQAEQFAKDCLSS